MSTILEALRKLEKRRPARGASGSAELDREIVAERADARRHPMRRFVLVATAVVGSGLAGVAVTLVVLAYWQSQVSEPQREAAPPAVAAGANPAEASRAEAATVVVARDVLRRRADEAAPAPPSVAQIVRKRDPLSELAKLREARVSLAPAEASPAAPAESSAETLEARRAETGRAELLRVEAEPLPVIVRDPVPAVAVMRTIWHPRKDRRRAELSLLEDGKTRIVELREGQFVGPLELREIGPTGVTFLHEGVEIRRRVGAGLHE